MQRSYVQHKRNHPESQWVEGRNYEFSRKMKVTIQQTLFREVFWHEYAKIPRHTSKNAITEGDFKCIFACNCEGTEQLLIIL